MERVHENNFNFLLARAFSLPLWTRSEQDRLSRHVDAESLSSIYLVILVNFLLVANDYINLVKSGNVSLLLLLRVTCKMKKSCLYFHKYTEKSKQGVFT